MLRLFENLENFGFYGSLKKWFFDILGVQNPKFWIAQKIDSSVRFWAIANIQEGGGGALNAPPPVKRGLTTYQQVAI